MSLSTGEGLPRPHLPSGLWGSGCPEGKEALELFLVSGEGQSFPLCLAGRASSSLKALPEPFRVHATLFHGHLQGRQGRSCRRPSFRFPSTCLLWCHLSQPTGSVSCMPPPPPFQGPQNPQSPQCCMNQGHS